MRPRHVLALAGATLVATAPGAGAQAPIGHHGAEPVEGPMISGGFNSFTPAETQIVTGDTVTWRIDGLRTHTVTAEDGTWSSERMTRGDTYVRRFDAPGSFAYYCVLHAAMRGRIDAHTVLLARPAAPAAPARAYPLEGRTALPEGTDIVIEGDTGAGFAPVATTAVDAHGAFTAEFVPRTSGTFRAVGGGQASPPVDLVVLDRRLQASATRRGRHVLVSAGVTPASPGTTAVLQLRLPERFGWWPVRRTRLDAQSRARFRIALRRRVPARVVLTLPDGATVLAESKVLALGARRHEKEHQHHPRSS